MTKRKPLVRVLLKETAVVDGQRRFFTSNSRGRTSLMVHQALAAVARVKRIEPLRLEVRTSP